MAAIGVIGLQALERGIDCHEVRGAVGVVAGESENVTLDMYVVDWYCPHGTERRCMHTL